MFQFHMVRLKELSNLKTNIDVSAFQFHMVRLKGCSGRRKALRSQVSIPHGTIKSQHSVTGYIRLAVVSIPHGTIKRPMPTGLAGDYIVSIPHGTIKS